MDLFISSTVDSVYSSTYATLVAYAGLVSS